MSRPLYLDYNATTPIDPAVAEAMLPFLYEHFGNPSSSHAYGAVARGAVEKARRQVAALLGARPEEIVFTSGGSEANNTVILGVARLLRSRGRHVVTSAVEHPAVLEPCAVLAAEGFRVTRVPVDEQGRVDPARRGRGPHPGDHPRQRHARQQRGGDDPAGRRDRAPRPRARDPGAHGRGAVARARSGSTWASWASTS